MKSDSHIVYIVPGFAKNEQDTSAVPYLQDLILGINEQHPSIKITIIALEYPYEESVYQWNGNNVYAIGGKNKKWPTKIFTLYKAFKLFEKIASHKKVAIVHSFWLGESTIVGNWINRKMKIPHIANAMGQDVLSSNKYLPYLSKKHHQKLIYLSEFQKSNSVYEHPNTSTISFGVKLNNGTPIEWKERKIDLLGVGSLIPIKQYDLFIEVAAILIKKGIVKNVVLAGSGPEQRKLEEQIEKLNLSSYIQLVGQKNRTGVFELMNNSKVFLHPSKFEGTGYVFLEALNNGMKIASFKCGIAKESNNWKIATTTIDLVNNCEELLKESSFKSKSEMYTVKETIDAFFKIYNEQTSGT
jgi:glycosyltransferase involved in cell wall biosynthesis